MSDDSRNAGAPPLVERSRDLAAVWTGADALQLLALWERTLAAVESLDRRLATIELQIGRIEQEGIRVYP